ncbi:hypothetical protein [Desulfobulbus oralis]|uniref:Uncharacterized protein n=1 Tax=Desulfobulbus oralis TaxID=1986146 RepID=A0A2L1GPX7_9BACT|nr:hypothetical protein [Desulfobulbus oralis]AVD71674.1 hypothetical protein CAY53_09495 [Desulfobulbus oralis]
MKKTTGAIIGILMVAVFVLAITPATRDELHWQWVSHKDETAGYESYIRAWPGGRHAGEAKTRYDQHGWTEATAANTVQGFERYLQLHGNGRHIAEARNNIESLHWQEATAANTVQGFERYLQLHGNGQHIAEARNNIDTLYWKGAVSTNTIQGFEEYIQLHSDGRYFTEAKERLDTLFWQEATNNNTVKAYLDYSAAQPQGRHLPAAKAKAAELLKEQAPFQAALKDGTEASLNKFLEEFPGHQKESEARKALRDIREGRDIVDLIAEKKIEVQATGSGIMKVSVRLRKRVPYPLTVHIPVGTFFVAAKTSSQNMVTTSASRILLTTDEWNTVSPDAACANRPKDIPGDSDRFTVRRSPQQRELARLMPVLEQARVDKATRQAAIWIVTDNASYEDLGILLASPFGFGGTRVINEEEAAQAMRICDAAGINIRKKAIWRDRREIMSGLKNDDLKTWMRQKK